MNILSRGPILKACPRRYSLVFTTLPITAADNWRVSQVRNIGAVEGSPLLKDNEWEAIERQGEAAIQRWIDSQMAGRPCVIVLIGSATAGRKWVKYEIKKAWSDGKGLLGIHIHNLQDRHARTAVKGKNPFEDFTLDGTSLASIVPVYDPTGHTSQEVYGTIAANIERWIENAIAVRNRHSK